MEWEANGVNLFGRWSTWRGWTGVPVRQNHRYVYMATALQLGGPVMHALNMHGGFRDNEGNEIKQLEEALHSRLTDAGYDYVGNEDDNWVHKRGEKCVYWAWTTRSIRIYIHDIKRVQYQWKCNYTFTRTIRGTIEDLTMNEFMDGLSVDIE